MSRDEDFDFDDRPARPPGKRPPARRDEDDFDDRPPAKRKPAPRGDDEDDFDDRPARASRRPRRADFVFVGTAGSYFVTGLLAYLLTLFTLGIGAPWAMCMVLQWQVENTRVEGRRLRFTGTGGALFGLWIKWFFLLIITLGFYSLWMVPELNRWIADRTEFDEYDD